MARNMVRANQSHKSQYTTQIRRYLIGAKRVWFKVKLVHQISSAAASINNMFSKFPIEMPSTPLIRPSLKGKRWLQSSFFSKVDD